VSEVHPRLLLIDDEEVVLDSCTAILAGGDYEVVTATSGAEGLQKVGEVAPDLIFVDLKMPGMSGMEVLEELRKLDPTLVAIVFTGFATIESAVEAMKRGAYDFLPKPFTPEEFRAMIRRGLEWRRLLVETTALRREREALRENFAAIVSHELRSPLGAVQQNLFVLNRELEGTISEDQKRRLERMSSRIKDLLGLINRWLRGFSVDFTSLKESFRPVAVGEAVAKAVESAEGESVRKGVDIVTEIDRSAVVLGDEGTLTEALLNLIGNAVKYSRPEGKVSVTARREAEKVVVSVVDTGVGIPDADLPRIFDGFYRGQAATSGTSGAGIGLAVTRRIVEVHGGSITAESTPGRGSTFVITLPALEFPPNGSVVAPEQVPKGEAG
jgi:two-component system sensor histidine kinase/response regulator